MNFLWLRLKKQKNRPQYGNGNIPPFHISTNMLPFTQRIRLAILNCRPTRGKPKPPRGRTSNRPKYPRLGHPRGTPTGGYHPPWRYGQPVSLSPDNFSSSQLGSDFRQVLLGIGSHRGRVTCPPTLCKPFCTVTVFVTVFLLNIYTVIIAHLKTLSRVF